MAGHSKWANIKHKKKAKDKKKSMLFSKLAKEIKTSLDDKNNTGNNAKLQTAINKALNNNLNKKIINKIISKKEKDKKKDILFFKQKEQILIIETEIDEKNKNIAEIKNTLNIYGFKYIENDKILNSFEKESNIKINNNYNEKSIINNSKKIDIIEFKDDFIYMDYLNIKEFKNINKKKIIQFNLNNTFIPKLIIKQTDNEKCEFKNLKKKLEKKEFITNIYSNIEL